MKVRRRHMLWLIVPCILLVSALWVPGDTASSSPLYTRQQRFGVGFVTDVTENHGTVPQSLSAYNLAPFQVGWYSDWSFAANPAYPADMAPGTLEYIQVLNVRYWPPDWDAVRNAVLLNPGATWIIGNEPECPNQGNLTPAQYAAIYREAYLHIKGWDDTAKVAIGGVVEPTPLRLRWLERAMESHQQQFGEPLEVDVWTIHMQILIEGVEGNPKAGAGVPVGLDPQAEGILPREYSLADCANVEIFKTLVTDFREWMKRQGQQNKPLIISEMGVLQPSIFLVEGGSEQERQERGDQKIEQFMVQVFDWLLEAKSAEIGCPQDENRLVQRWLWFSLNGSFWDEATNPQGFNGSLYDYRTKTLTRFGRRFIAYQQQTKRLGIPIVLK